MLFVDFGFFMIAVLLVGFALGRVSGRGRAFLKGHAEGIKVGHDIGYNEAFQKFGKPFIKEIDDI